MTTPYRKVSNRFWTSATVRLRLSEDARWLFLYLITCTHNNNLGLFVLPEMYALADLRTWPPAKFRKAFDELQTVERGPDPETGEPRPAGVIAWDEKTEMVLLRDHLEMEGCDNPNHVKGALSFLRGLPGCSHLYVELADTCKGLGKPYLKPLEDALRKRFESVGERKGKASGNPPPNTETETETETDHDNINAEPAIFELPVLGGGTYRVTKDMVDEWTTAFPSVDVPQTILSAKAWLKANPSRAKKNVERFLVNRFSYVQERGGNRGVGHEPHGQPNQKMGGKYAGVGKGD